jgi:formylmethanofuran dehydrogenase subunit B
MQTPPLSVIDNVACTACGCVCDDLRLTISGGRIVRTENACGLAEPWLLAQNSHDEPEADIDGQSASAEEALDRSADILRSANYPFVYGLSQSTTEGQRASIALAERLGAVIDTSASVCHAPSVMAQQEVGKVTCTLGEIRNRADVVIFWGSDPVTTHPRHWERYSVHPTGRFIPRGRADRFVAVADVTRTATAAEADFFLPIEPGRHFEALFALRALLNGAIPDPGRSPGAPVDRLTELAQRMKRARCGVIFFGVELARGEAGHCNVEILLQMVTDLNVPGRWFAMRMRVQGNVVGADSVMAWQTGYPFAVNLARGFPRYNPGEFSVRGVLERKEADACVVIGSDTLNWLPPAAIDHVRQIPTIIIDPAGSQPPLVPTVRFRTGTAGVHESGTVYRMDGVPIPVKAVLPSRYPTAAQILREIERRL